MKSTKTRLCRSYFTFAPEEIKKKTGNPDILFMELNLSSFKKVQRFTDEFLSNEDRLDILINNAGMLSSTPEVRAPKLTENGIELTLMVNYFGPFLLTNNLLDTLKRSGPGSRVVTVSSLNHDFANPSAFKDLDNNLRVDGAANFALPDRPTVLPRSTDFVWHAFKSVFDKPGGIRYSNSKLAQVLFSQELGKRLVGTGVTTYSLHPGAILTDIGADRESGNYSLGFDIAAFMDVAAKLPDFVQPLTFAFKSLVEGAQTTICCAVDEKLALETGLYYSDCEKARVNRSELNDEFAAAFWEWSERVIRQARAD